MEHAVADDRGNNITKFIKIDVDKCNGCRACEAICSAFHSEPKYSSTNPEKSRIRVIFDPIRDVYVPVFAGEFTEAECSGRDIYVIDDKTYDECAFCRASCPSRDLFKDPESGLPLKCDTCMDDPPLDEPLCVKWCLADALTYEEKEEEEEKEATKDDMESSIEALVKTHGIAQVMKKLAMIKKNNVD